MEFHLSQAGRLRRVEDLVVWRSGQPLRSATVDEGDRPSRHKMTPLIRYHERLDPHTLTHLLRYFETNAGPLDESVRSSSTGS